MIKRLLKNSSNKKQKISHLSKSLAKRENLMMEKLNQSNNKNQLSKRKKSRKMTRKEVNHKQKRSHQLQRKLPQKRNEKFV